MYSGMGWFGNNWNNWLMVLNKSRDAKKQAVIFPGMGYNKYKPLLYYGKRILIDKGYTVTDVEYGDIPKDRFEAYDIAASRAFAMLDEIDFSQAEDIVFISKSIGTIIAGQYAMERKLPARNIFCTPLPESLQFMNGNGIAFNGDADPYAPADEIGAGCKQKSIPLYTYKGGNHSIETSDIVRNTEYITDIVKKYLEYI
jgi:hypothetical protein